MVAAGVTPTLAIYGTMTYGSPLYFLTPLFACLAAVGVQGILSSARPTQIVFGLAAGLLFAVQYPLGVNLSLRAKPWYPVAEPTLVQLGEWQPSRGPISRIALGIGPGGAVANTEAVRFCSGLLFHPLALHSVRRQILEAFEVMEQTIQRHETEQPPLLVYTSEWCTCTQVHKALQDLGYSCIERTHIGEDGKPGDRFEWKRENHTILHVDAWEIFDPWDHPEFSRDCAFAAMALVCHGRRTRAKRGRKERPRTKSRVSPRCPAVGVRFRVRSRSFRYEGHVADKMMGVH